MKKRIKYFAFLSVLLTVACDKTEEIVPIPIPDPVELSISPEIALKWSELTVQVLKDAPDNSPTYASRSLGYIGLTMYESVVNGSIIFKSIAEELNGLGALPKADSLDWELALNAGQAQIIKLLYPHATEALNLKIDSLYSAISSARKSTGIQNDLATVSELYGKTIAFHVFEWSKSDKGHEGYKITFDSQYIGPRDFFLWSPPSVGQADVAAPMHPYWGENRRFLMTNKQLPMPDFISHETDTSSAYYKDMKVVYDVNKVLTQEDKETALWWGDDPGTSASPPGHSYYLTAFLVNEKQSNLFEAASAFAKVGMSVADAFVNTWEIKYHYNSERPFRYIRRNMDRRYRQFWPEPPFPAFTSGHSTQAAAAATALISVYGDDNSLTDKFHTGRPMDMVRNVEFKTRQYDSIWEFALECGYSRILGGIHTPQDNVIGLEEGKKIGDNVVALGWKY